MQFHPVHLKPEFYQAFSQLSRPTEQMGFTGFIYDYAPVPTAHDGQLISPAILQTYSTPDDMSDLWCGRGYYQADPVQQYSVTAATPFAWSYRHPKSSVLKKLMAENDQVTSYMNDNNIAQGVTVPIHWPDGSMATLTGLVDNSQKLQDYEAQMANFFLLAYRFHESVVDNLALDHLPETLSPLSKRERECLSYSAEGLTAKEIARIINRSIATVNMHLNSAIQKLGASNRTQAVVRAMHYRLLNR